MLVLTNARLIDGTGRDAVEGASVVIEGRRISYVGTDPQYGESAAVVDLDGLVLMPGLIDLHVHCGGIVHLEEGEPNFVDREASDDYAEAREHAIGNGVTTLRSCGDFFPDCVEVRDDINAGRLAGPRLSVSGVQFIAPGGHPAYTIMGGDPYILEHSVVMTDDPQEARREVRRVVEGGVDFIKAQLASLDAWNYPRKLPKLSLDVLEAVIDEAHKLGRRVAVHSEAPQDAYDAVVRGADSIEHLMAVGADSADLPDGLVDLMLKNGTYVVPTLAVTSLYTDLHPGPKKYPEFKKTLGEVYRAGVNIVAGTDAGAPDVQFGEACHIEMELLTSVGVSNMDAIVAATGKAAACLGWQQDLGTVQKGKLADLVAVSGDPLSNIGDTRNVRLVVADGKIVVDRLDHGPRG
jgi:imidazolonepropionase-like amidohydrolase